MRGSVLAIHRKRRDRFSLGPAGRNLFISRDKQLQARQARHIRWWMRAVLALVILAAAVGAGLFVAFYMVPYFHAEIVLPTGSEGSSSLSSGDTVELPAYDALGLPVYPDDVSLFVINRDSPADASYVPDTEEVEGVQVESRVVPALEALVQAAREEGLQLVFTEGYVPYGEQERRFSAKVEELMEGPQGLTTVMARTEARFLVPMAGECDQQTGFCVRLDGDPETFGDSRTCSWLRAHMGEYGFIFRYPEDQEDYTGCYGDYTVLRYVGSEHAVAMQQRSMCLEEYIGYLASQG